MTFWKLNEDPFYDDDGVLIEEDADAFENMVEAADLNRKRKLEVEVFSPHMTVNS